MSLKVSFIWKMMLCGILCCSLPLYGQEEIQTRGLKIPDVYTRSVDSLALYIDRHCPTEEGKLQALYVWIITHMTYNANPASNEKEEVNEEAVRRTLQIRDGVCKHFAKLFSMTGERMNLPVYVVDGYIKTYSGALMSTLHNWCVAKVEGKWYCYDPTFGIGGTYDDKFVLEPSMKYCKMLPETAIRTHMPCDPIWQLLEHPITYQAFDIGAEDASPYDTPFNYNDSIQAYLQQQPLERLLGIKRRMERNGRSNYLTDYYKQVNDINIAHHSNTPIYDKCQSAMKLYDQAFDIYHDLNHYRNNHFLPKRKKKAEKESVNRANYYIMEAYSILNSIQGTSSSLYVADIDNLTNSLHALKEEIDKLAVLMKVQKKQ